MEYYQIIIIWAIVSFVITAVSFGFNNTDFSDVFTKDPLVTILTILVIMVLWPVFVLWFFGKFLGRFIEDRW